MPPNAQISKPTEQAVVKLEVDLRAEHARLDGLLSELEAEIRGLQVSVLFVDAWLSGLPERDRWLVTKCVIDGGYLRDIAVEWHRMHGVMLTKRQVQRMRNDAMLKIYEMAQ
jgi:hypothetical protein